MPVLPERRLSHDVRHGVVLDAGDKEQQPSALMAGVHLRLGVEGEVGCGSLEQGAGPPQGTSSLPLMCGLGNGPARGSNWSHLHPVIGPSAWGHCF